MNKSIKHKFYAVLGMAVFFSMLIGCDKNGLSPDNLDNYGGLSLHKFATNDSTTIPLGQSISVDYSINDEDGELDHMTVVDSFGKETVITAATGNSSVSGNVPLTPGATTDYQMKVFAKGENSPRAISQPLHVDVYDPAHPSEMIFEPSVAEAPENNNCADGIDNDYGDGADCGDPGCATDTACVDQYAISYTLTPDGQCYSCEGIINCSCAWGSGFEGDAPVYFQDQTVEVAWSAGGCGAIYMTDENGDYSTEALSTKSKHQVTLDTDKSLALYCMIGDSTVPKSSVTIGMTQHEKAAEAPEPKYHGSVQTYVRSSVVSGEDITYSWKITSAYLAASIHYEIKSDDETISEDRSVATRVNELASLTITADEYANANAVIFTFNLTDDQGLSDSEPATALIEHFTKNSESTSIGDIKQIVPGYDGETYYVLTKGGKIYKTTDGIYFRSATTASFSGDMLAMAVNSDGDAYVATSNGIYLGSTPITEWGGDSFQTIQALYVTADGVLYVGTSKMMYKMWKTAESNCDNDTPTSEEFYEHGYCQGFATFGTRADRDDWYDAPLSITHFIPYLYAADTVIATSVNGGSFVATEATNNDFTISLLNDPSPIGGIIRDADFSYLWSATNLYTYNLEENKAGGAFGPDLSSDSIISGYLEFAGMIFVATNKGIYYRFENGSSEWTFSALDSPVMALIAVDDVGSKSVRTILANGSVYDLVVGVSQLGTLVGKTSIDFGFDGPLH